MTLDVPAGTPLDKIQIPGVDTPIVSIADSKAAPAPAPQDETASPAREQPRRAPRRARRKQAQGGRREGREVWCRTRSSRRRARSKTRFREADGLPTAAEPDVLAGAARPGADRRAELLHRQVPDPAVPAADLPGRRHPVRDPLGGPGRDQRDRDRLRPQPQRLLRRRAGLDAVHARHLEAVRHRRQQGRQPRPLQPRRRDLRRRPLPQGRRRRNRPAQGDLRLQPRRLVRRQRAHARPRHRRPARRPRRLAHRPDPGPLPRPRRARYADDISERDARRRIAKGRNAALPVEANTSRRGINIYTKPGSPVIAVQDGKIVKLGRTAAPGQVHPAARRLRQHLHLRAPAQPCANDLPAALWPGPYLSLPWPSQGAPVRASGAGAAIRPTGRWAG